MYVIRGKRLRGGQGAGEWTLSLSGGDSIPNNNDTQYSYNVLVQSPVLTEPQFPKATLLTGMQFLMEMQLAGVCAERLKGLTSVEFLQWLMDVSLTSDEVEYIMSVISDKEIRKAVMTKANANTVI